MTVVLPGRSPETSFPGIGPEDIELPVFDETRQVLSRAAILGEAETAAQQRNGAVDGALPALVDVRYAGEPFGFNAFSDGASPKRVTVRSLGAPEDYVHEKDGKWTFLIGDKLVLLHTFTQHEFRTGESSRGIDIHQVEIVDGKLRPVREEVKETRLVKGKQEQIRGPKDLRDTNSKLYGEFLDVLKELPGHYDAAARRAAETNGVAGDVREAQAVQSVAEAEGLAATDQKPGSEFMQKLNGFVGRLIGRPKP